jgi:predicted GNAT family acetyltransferase
LDHKKTKSILLKTLLRRKYGKPIQNRQSSARVFFHRGKRQSKAELDFAINGDVINAYHTGREKRYEGQGIAGKISTNLCHTHAKMAIKIIPTCSYILANFDDIPNFSTTLVLHSEDDRQEMHAV